MKKLYFFFFTLLLAYGCKKEKESDAKAIVSFTIAQKDNSFLSTDIKGVMLNDTVTIPLPNDTVSKILIPTIQVSNGAVITPASKQRENFTSPVHYQVKAADGTVLSFVAVCKPITIIPSVAQLSGLTINGADCAFDALSKTFYYPVSLGTTLNNYTVGFDTLLTKYLTFDNIKSQNGTTVNYGLTTNKTVKILAFDKYNQPVLYSLIITGLPIVQLTASQTIADNAVTGLLKLVDPDYQAQNTQLEISSPISIQIRGNSARFYPKKAYSMDLTDALGNKNNQSLLGLRNDDNWILDAMYIDQARMRNRVCTDIWNTFNNVPYSASQPTALNGTRGHMTELFLNDQYWGLYCLTEKIDQKQLQVQKNYGGIYKADDFTDQTFFNAALPYSNSSDTWGGWEFAYPDLGNNPAPDWSYLYNLVNFVATSSDADFENQIAAKVNINNLVDYFIFINSIGGYDNIGKNNYFSFYDYRTAGQFFYTVWDLDGSIGRMWNGSLAPSYTLLLYQNNLIARLLYLNAGGFVQKVQARWQVLKSNQLSASIVTSCIEGYKNQLINTGAFAREMKTWNNITQDLPVETQFMESWYNTRLSITDQYINALPIP